jgi:hypothetical protein
MKWTGDESLSIAATGLIVAFLAALVLAMIMKGRKLAEPVALECSVLLILIPLISPLGWDYTLLMSVLGVTILVHYYFEYPRFWRGALAVNFTIIALSIYDLMGQSFYKSFMAWSVLTINFLILVGYLAHLRFRKVR